MCLSITDLCLSLNQLLWSHEYEAPIGQSYMFTPVAQERVTLNATTNKELEGRPQKDTEV